MQNIILLCISLLLVSVVGQPGFQNGETGISIAKYLPFSNRYARAWLSGLIPTTVGNVSEQCKLDSVKYQTELAALTPWALEMFDATGKLPDGILNGNWHALGDYEQCLRVQPENESFRGKYCQVFLWIVKETEEKMFPLWLFQLFSGFGPPLPPGEHGVLGEAQPTVGVCLPSSCSAKDFSTAITAMTTGESSIFGGVGITGSTNEGFCSVFTEQPPELDTGAIVMWSVLGVIAFFIVTGTILDILVRHGIIDISSYLTPRRKLTGFVYRIFNSFSVRTNGAKLLSTKTSGDNISCIHGLRFISFTWVLLGHAFSYQSSPTPNFILLLELAQSSVAFQAISNAGVSVDSFFFITGLLLAYLYLKAMQRTGTKWGITVQINPFMLILHRFLRLTPVYAMLIGIYIYIWPTISDSPAWYIVEYQSALCRGRWWANLLYIQNFVFDDHACLNVTWYLDVEFQIFVVATLFVWLMFRYEFLGVFLTALFTLVGAVIGAIFMAVWDMPPTSFVFPSSLAQFEGVSKYGRAYYRMAWFRYPPLFIGMLTGWSLYKVKQSTYIKPNWLTPNISRLLSLVGWAVAALSAIGIMYGMYNYHSPTARLPVPKELQVFYGGFHRTVWAMCLAWLVFACVTGYGGPINSFLCWKPFMVLGRLTFAAYLIHCEWMTVHLAHRRLPVYYTNLTMAYALIGHVVFTLVLSTIATLAFEAPFLNIEKLIFEPSKNPNPQSEKSQDILKKERSNSEKNLSIPIVPINFDDVNGIQNPGFDLDEQKTK